MAIKFLTLIGTFVFSIVLWFDGQAQTEAEIFTAKNAVYVELGGNAGSYAVNYGRIFHQKGSFKFSASLGFSMMPENMGKTFLSPVLPLEITALYGKSKHHLEVGIGITPYLKNTYGFAPRSVDPIITSNQLQTVVPLRIGYRYQKPKGGFFYRIGYTPMFGSLDGNIVFHPIHAGVSLGKSF